MAVIMENAVAENIAESASPSRDDEPDPVVVRVNNLSKTYGLWSSPSARLALPALKLARKCAPVWPAPLQRLEERAKGAYREFQALQDISFEIRRGESWGFVGVNGSGKSTLLKMISGNLRPSQGSVEIDGKVAILDYSSGLNGEFTGRENVYIKASIFGMSRREIDERFDSIAAFADIGDFIEQPVKIYSSGMAARLGFAILAHVDAEILITDEALAVGDAFFVQKCMSHIRLFLKRGTFLFVSHSVNDVVALCQKAVWLDEGRIKAIGSAKEVTEAYLAFDSIKSSRRFLLNSSDETEDRSERQGPRHLIGNVAEISQPELSERAHMHRPKIVRDPRLEYLNHSKWRNDIEIPEFDPEAEGFGIGGARIENVTFEDEDGNTLSWVIGAEAVRLKIGLIAERNLETPIVGFQVKDRLGQTLFADTTFLATVDQPIAIPAGKRFAAEFLFQMPLLPVGQYVIRAAVAQGSESENAMMHCIDNALVFNSTTSGARHGLIGVPMQRVSLRAGAS